MTFTNGKRNLLAPGALSLGLCLATAWLAEPARACSWPILSIGVSFPTPNAVDVPTNAVLFADGPALTAADFELVDDAGNSVAIKVAAVEAGGFDIEPLEEMAANRGYLLRVPANPGASRNTIAFTTGSGPAEVQESLSVPELDPTAVSYSVGTCGLLTRFCMGSPAPAPQVLLEARIGREILVGHPSGIFHRLFDNDIEDGECMTVQARNIRGHRSPPAIACAGAMRRYELGMDEMFECSQFGNDDLAVPAPVESHPGPSDADSSDLARAPYETSGSVRGGCSLGPGERGSNGPAWALLVACLGLFARRPRET